MLSVDLRSDTVTLPTQAMKQAMFDAPVGDDMYGEDPSVSSLEQKAADYFGMEAALFCPSGTMCNQIGIRLHTKPQSEVICDQYAHIYLYEAGGIAANSLSSVKLFPGKRGQIDATYLQEYINPADQHFATTSLVALENTSNKGGGSCYDLSNIKAIHKVCQQHELKLHLDGARLFNALVKTGDDPKVYGEIFDSISICLSKGLGAPVGSVLLCKEKDYEKAKRIRKTMGGAMRQAGYLAAAGSYALDHHVDRLTEDHQRAQVLAEILEETGKMEEILPVETNIVVFKPDPSWKSDDTVLKALAETGIKISSFGHGYLRMVTHLDISDEMIDSVSAAFKILSA